LNNIPSKKELLHFMEKQAQKPLFPEEVAEAIGLPTSTYQEIEQVLKELEKEGLIVQMKKGRYSVPHKVNMFLGNLRTTKQGYGFISPLGETLREDIFIPSASMKNAIDGDLVLVNLTGRSHKGLEGEIARIVRRGRNKLVCEFVESHHITFAAPINKRILVNILIPSEKREDAKDGDAVVIKITNWNLGRNGMMEGEVIERLGPITDPRYDLTMILREFNISSEFPEEVLEEARQAPQEVSKENIEPDRQDLRSLNCFTIDGVDAKDFDDAVSLETDRGNYKLGVHIADVSYYVPEGSALDEEAESRTSSLYFSEAVVPMLPVQLSNGICSLNPNTPRRAISVFIWVSPDGQIIKTDITRSIITSKARLNYDQVQRFMDGAPPSEEDLSPDVAQSLTKMLELAEILWKKRFQRGCLELDIPEMEIEVDDKGEPRDIYLRKRNWSHRIIEEFMILANESIAHFCLKHTLPTLFRVHAEPTREKLEFLSEYLTAFGIKKSSAKLSRSHELQDVLEKVEDKPWEYAVNTLLLRSMMKAQYSPENIGHFGLGSKAYVHFTSPIRRYPDLIVHRILSDHLANGLLSSEKKKHYADKLPFNAQHCNKTELIINEVERDYLSLKSAQFMANFIGEEFKGVISGVLPFGLFVELERFPVEGLCKMHSLNNDYYEYDEDRLALIGKRTNHIYTMGMEMQVIVKEVNILDREIDLEPVPGAPPQPFSRKRKGGKTTKKNKKPSSKKKKPSSRNSQKKSKRKKNPKKRGL